MAGVRLETIPHRLQNSLSSEHPLGGAKRVCNPVRAHRRTISLTSKGRGLSQVHTQAVPKVQKGVCQSLESWGRLKPPECTHGRQAACDSQTTAPAHRTRRPIS